MAEQCGTDAPDDVDEYDRDERVETIYEGWGAREMAERIVDLEDELGADVDGICTGMHADVAEADAEIERQASALRTLEGDCIRLSEELDEARATNDALVKDVRDGAHWEGVADRMRDEISRLKDLLAYEHNRADSAIDREETAEQAAEESREEAERLRAVVADYESRISWFTTCAQCAGLLDAVYAETCRVDRYRSAWLSARRRAADEANFGMEALELKQREADRWRRGHETAEAQLVWERRDNERLTFLFRHAQDRADNLAAENERLRKTTHAPQLEPLDDGEGGTVWRLGGSTDGVDVYVAPVGAPAPKIR